MTKTLTGVVALAGVLALAPALAAESQDVAPKNVCILGTSVVGTTVVDNKTVLFRMNDGTVWRNTLKKECPHLGFERGFSQVIRGNMICANMQVITVLQSGTPCQLGDFTHEPRKTD